MMLIAFASLTFGISLAGFACIALLPAARSPATLVGLPFWLIMVWGPSLAAILLSLRSDELTPLLGRAVRISTVPTEVWGLVAAPLVLLMVMKLFAPQDPTSLRFGTAVLMVVFNLVLGPLGEELGWRGLMQEDLASHLGWLEASLLVGIVWFAWHLPLWTIDSPHAQVSLPLFAIHCLLYSIIIGAAYHISGGSILPAILLHLNFNLAANWAVFAGYRDPDAWFSASALPYALIGVAAAVLVYLKTGESGLRWLQFSG
ncbi:CAAX prenyl protease-like protein [Hoeflea halophila]|uniref:CAAX prenyl protease-like protein n=1 Tax=Hoeflea halophila TaxID=714899 RepID=A0A286HRT2_9HYPH|nr:CPBP family intramembrane glutamic endopeptidase [Hoeflea halophila]SOE10540.1 CAAX prenyl protease-like protein [Hoeflea halophila]